MTTKSSKKKILIVITKSNFGGTLLGNPRFSNTRRLVAFLYGKTNVFPTLF